MAYSQPFPLAIPQSNAVKDLNFDPDLAVRLICPVCRDPNLHIVEEFCSGKLVCGDCDLVLGNLIVDIRSEWRTFASKEGEDSSRVGAASDPLMEGKGHFGAVVGRQDDNSDIAHNLWLATSLQESESRSVEQILLAFRDISHWCHRFSLPETISDIAKRMYKYSYEAKLLRYKHLEAVIAACIFLACRQAHVPRTFREICGIMNVSKRVLGHCFRVLERAFGLAPDASITSTMASPTTTGPESFLSRYCEHLDLPAEVKSVCSDIIVAARQHGIADGRSPSTIAGAATFFTCHLLGKVKSVKDITAVAGVSEWAIKQIYRLYYADKGKLVKQEWIDEGKATLDLLPCESTSLK